MQEHNQPDMHRYQPILLQPTAMKGGDRGQRLCRHAQPKYNACHVKQPH